MQTDFWTLGESILLSSISYFYAHNKRKAAMIQVTDSKRVLEEVENRCDQDTGPENKLANGNCDHLGDAHYPDV